jgi:hypothetical protein
LLELAQERLAILSVPVVVIAEWWRGRTGVRERILDVVNVGAALARGRQGGGRGAGEGTEVDCRRRHRSAGVGPRRGRHVVAGLGPEKCLKSQIIALRAP